MQMKRTKSLTSKMNLRKFIRALFSKETPGYIKAIIGLAVAYTVFPIDALPDLLGVVGFADDAAVLTLLTTLAMTLLDNHNSQKATQQMKTAPEAEEVDE